MSSLSLLVIDNRCGVPSIKGDREVRDKGRDEDKGGVNIDGTKILWYI